MEINKTCLDCKFANWDEFGENLGLCEWKFPNILLPQCLSDIRENRIYQTIGNQRLYIDCSTWEKKEESDELG